MRIEKRFILSGFAVCTTLALLAGIWGVAIAAEQISSTSRTVSLDAGSPADAWSGQAGVYFSNSIYSGNVVVSRPKYGNQDSRLAKQDLTRHHPYLEFKVEDPAWKQVYQLRGLNYVYFNLNSEERILWNEEDLAIYFYNTSQGQWVECLANHLVNKGDYGRLGCLVTHTGLYVLAEKRD